MVLAVSFEPLLIDCVPDYVHVEGRIYSYVAGSLDVSECQDLISQRMLAYYWLIPTNPLLHCKLTALGSLRYIARRHAMSITQRAEDILGSKQDAQAMAEWTAYSPFSQLCFLRNLFLSFFLAARTSSFQAFTIH